MITALAIFGIFILGLLGYFGILFAVHATVLMLRDGILNLSQAYFGARQLAIDAELEQQKNELQIEFAREKLQEQRQNLLS